MSEITHHTARYKTSDTKQAMKEFDKHISREAKTKAFYKYISSKTKIKNGIPELTCDGKLSETYQEKQKH